MPSTNSAVFFIVLILMQHNCCYANGKEKPDGLLNKVKETIEVASENEMIRFGAKTAAVAGAVIVAAPLAAAAAGFGAAGIAAGSVAAGVQATWFGGAITGLTGAAFGALQSIGAAGLGLGAKSAIVAGTAATLKAFDGGSDKSDDKETDNNKHSVEF